MKKILTTIIALIFLIALDSSSVAQFNVSLPKVPKVNKETPKADQPSQPKASSDKSTGSSKSTSSYPAFRSESPTNIPKFLGTSIEISVKTEHQNEFSKFIPIIRFDSFYDQSSTLRYVAEWSKGNGAAWFTESLDASGSRREYMTSFKSPYDDDNFKSNATNIVGPYGVKVTDSKTGTVIFQGKFKVGKLPMSDAKQPNYNLFYVDQDWSLPVGAVGFDFDNWHSDQLNPSIFLWFKGEIDAKNLEARLFNGGQMVASTDDGGYINNVWTRGEDCFLKREVCSYTLWKFYWTNFILESNNYGRGKYPGAIFTRDKPGEYTVKVFHKGIQVRELSFNIDSQGFFASNPWAKHLPMVYGGLVVPVKVMGTLDKWNPAGSKNEPLYGNLIGFPTN